MVNRKNQQIMQHMQKFLLIVLWLGFSTGLLAQQVYHEYVLSGSSEKTEDTIADMLENGASHLYSDPEMAREIAYKALTMAENMESHEWQMKLLNFIGISYMVQSNYERAIDYYHQAKDLARAAGSYSQTGNSLNNIAVAHGDIGDYISALRYFLMALDEYDQAGMADQEAYVYNNIGMIYAEIENFEKAREYYQNSHKIFHELQDSIRIGTLLINLGSLHYKQEKLDSAMTYLDSAIVYKKLTADKFGLASAKEEKAKVLFDQDELYLAKKEFFRARDLAEELGFDSGRASILIGLAELSLAAGSLEKAENLALEAMDLATKINNNKLEYKSHKTLSAIYEKSNNHLRALSHFKLYNQLKDESLNQKRLHQIYNQEMQRAAEISTREIKERERMLSRKNTTIFFMSFAFVSTLIILVLTYYLYAFQQKQKARKRLHEDRLNMTRERARFALEAEIIERKRLGLELHDGIGPMLSLAKLNVSGLLEKPGIQNEGKTRILENTLSTINQILREMKSISHNMAPMILIEKGLPAALQDLAYKLNDTQKYHVSLEITGLNDKLDDFLEHAVFRSVQEIVNNTIMHAKASRIIIQITGNGEDLTMMIEDDGTGFDPNDLSQNGGIGLKSSATRIESLGGQFYIDSVIGRGTIVTMIIPLFQKV